MGVHLKLVDYTEVFNSLSFTPKILNDIVTITNEQKQAFNKLTTTTYVNTDVFSNEPSCECGNLKGTYRLSEICELCVTPVREIFDGTLESRIWFRSPKKVAPLFNPSIWIMLQKTLTRGQVSVLEWMTVTTYNPPDTVYEMQVLMEAGFVRGYNSFQTNFIKVLDVLIEAKVAPAQKLKGIKELCLRNKSAVFTNHLPLPNKTLLVIEKNPMARYVEDTAAQLLDIIKTMTGIDTQVPLLNNKQLENRTAKCQLMLANYHEEVTKNQISKKNGLPRKHLFGTRNTWSVRSVISSRTDAHKYDEILIAWGHAVVALSVHIKNKLINKRGYTPLKAAAFINACVQKYSAEMDEVLTEIFSESNGGLKAVFVRNPSLTQSSVEVFKVVGFKKNPSDPTISFSILCVRG